jgi:hypothetical protein
MIRFDERKSMCLVPCNNVAICPKCWEELFASFKEALNMQQGIDYDNLEAFVVNDASFVIPRDLLPKCPICRSPVKSAFKVFI